MLKQNKKFYPMAWWFGFLMLSPLVFIQVLGCNKIFVREVAYFLMSVTVVMYFAYGALMSYPGVKTNYPKENVNAPYVRLFLLALSVFIAWGSIDYYQDVFTLFRGEADYENVSGTVTNVETVWGSAPFLQTIWLDGDSQDYAYYFSYLSRLPSGSKYEFIVLKHSKVIVDDKRL